MAPKHLGGNAGWVLAGTQNDDPGAGDLPQQTCEIVICRDQDEAVGCGVLQNPAITGTGKPVSKCTFGVGEKVAQ